MIRTKSRQSKAAWWASGRKTGNLKGSTHMTLLIEISNDILAMHGLFPDDNEADCRDTVQLHLATANDGNAALPSNITRQVAK